MPETPETLRQRAERIYKYEVTSDPVALALAEDRDLVGTTLTPEQTFRLAMTHTKAVRVALLDLADQLDALLGGQVKPE